MNEKEPPRQQVTETGQDDFSDENSLPDADIASDPFILKYRDGWARKHQEIENAHPVHPTTGEPGTFVRFSRQYPIYATERGDEFIVMRGIPKLLRKS